MRQGRAVPPRPEQGKQVGGVRVAIAINITVRRAPRAEQVQKVRSIDVAIAIEVRRLSRIETLAPPILLAATSISPSQSKSSAAADSG